MSVSLIVKDGGYGAVRCLGGTSSLSARSSKVSCTLTQHFIDGGPIIVWVYFYQDSAFWLPAEERTSSVKKCAKGL